MVNRIKTGLSRLNALAAHTLLHVHSDIYPLIPQKLWTILHDVTHGYGWLRQKCELHMNIHN